MVSPIGVGTNRWSLGANDQAVSEAFTAFQDAGGDLVDTAEIYGFGKSERLVGQVVRAAGRPAFVASKFAPFLLRNGLRDLLRALDASLARLSLPAVDLYLIHFPLPFTDFDALADALVEAVRSGKARRVGVSNFGAEAMRKIAARLERAGVPLAANEVHYSLLHRNPEANGVLDACRALDCALIAYFPLASGRLAAALPAEGPQAALRQALAAAAEAHGGSVGQAALNWLLQRDERVIAIPGATKARHAADNLAALTWTLTDEEFAAIDRASAPHP
jgi:aryl-alcohol dehydrogenase-like predicted oxidoreductase